MFDWLRNRVRLAVVAGFADAVSELDTREHHADALEAVQQLQARLVPALPAPDQAEDTPPRRKAR